MSASMQQIASGEHPITLRLDGVFDVPTAQKLAHAIADAGDRPVQVDLTRVREFHDFGVALLARSLAGRPAVSVSGLRQHHLRLLRYLGIDAGPVDLGMPVELA